MRYFCFNGNSALSLRVAGKAEQIDHLHIIRTLDECECFIVTAGELYIYQDGVEYSLKPGDYFMSEPFIEYGGYRPSTATFHWLHFVWYEGEAEFADGPTEFEYAIPQYGHLDKYDGLLIIQILLEQYSRLVEKRRVVDALLSAFLRDLCMLSTARDTVKNKDKRFQPILEYLDFSPNYQEINDVKTMAAVFGYNEKYLIRIFKKNTGMTPLQYLTDKKIMRSQQMLADTDLTVQAVAANLHYDYYYFLRLFKRYTGMTPTEYRKTVIPGWDGRSDRDKDK